MENLRCTVTNCVHNENSYCTAEHIDVYTSEHGLANSSSGTACRTFKPKSVYRNIGFK